MEYAYYPVSLDLRGRVAVVIGSGEVASAKVRALLEAGAVVRVVDASPDAAIEALAREHPVELVRREYRSGDLVGAWLAISTPTVRAQNADLWREAEANRVLLNAADDSRHCHFIAPATLRHGPLSVAVSTGGASPALAVHLRDRIGAIVRPEHGALATLLGGLRADLNRQIIDIEQRARFWRHAVAWAVSRLDVAPARREKKGRVTLVGAGPGRAGLITVAGWRALRRADAVIYDRLVHRRLLRVPREGAQLIHAGKRRGSSRATQEWINETMIELARDGHSVVRLKGGDPYVFGRGAEEAATLREAGIAVRVIPGVSSAVAAPGAAGIPVTHREHSSAFVVVSAEQSAHSPPIDWNAVARIQTVVVLMGARHATSVLQRLRAHGVAGDTPAALIGSATLREERVVAGTLDALCERLASEDISAPATLVVGAVAGLARAKSNTVSGTVHPLHHD
jgi:uroporphyrin-III C-methyltransferase/precorrin-2 dehydrogenase/sirohydrochlorin ferrochelatase